MSFALLPPELNSTLMYTGPGAGSMAAAATGWDELASELYSTAESYQAVVTGLMAGWRGPSSVMMASAAQPYVAWMNMTASLAAEAGAQAKAAVAAFEMAYTAVVPPAEVELNRTTMTMLEATNYFGQNSTAIALTEEQYLQMWIQDAVAMDTYAVAASHASTLAPFNTPMTTANPAAATAAALPSSITSAGAGIVSWLQQITSQLPVTMSSLTTWVSSVPGLSGTVAAWQAALAPSNFSGLLTPAGLTSALSSPATSTTMQLSYYVGRYATYPATMASSFSKSGSSTASAAGGLNMDALSGGINNIVSAKLAPIAQTLSDQFSSMNRAVLAGIGHANSVSGLSVPQAWAHAAGPAMDRAAPMLPQTSVAAPAMHAGMPSLGGPFTQGLMGALSGRGLAGVAGKVGPKIIPRSPAGG